MQPELKFTKRMLALFGVPDGTSVEDVVAEYANALRGHDETALQRAADRIARTRRIRAWPTVAECLDAVEEASKVAPASATLKIIKNFHVWWGERLAKIDAAETETEIAAQIDMVRPYADAKWIAPHHWAEAEAHAARRRKQWSKDGARKVAMRVVGEGE
jgi:hypothetical protein